jgi:hypothetical protein
METTVPETVPYMPPALGALFILFIVFVSLMGIVLTILIYCMVFYKAGYSWALGLLMLVPIANIIMPFVLAFSDWPIRRELRLLKQKQNDTTG